MRPSFRVGVVAVAVALTAGACTPSKGAGPKTSPVAQQTDTAAAPKQLAQLPTPGTVTVVQGPFSDRISLTDVRLTRRTVETTLKVTSDVSELIDLELSAAFYDASGHLLGVARTTYAEGDGGDGKPQAETAGVPLTVVWKGAGTPTSARLSVPVLVNE